MKQLRREDYNVGWLCERNIEYLAASLVLDEEHSAPAPLYPLGPPVYTFGSIGVHNVVISISLSEEPWETRAAAAAHRFSLDFPNLELRYMVGIGGGAPTEQHDIRLGDVVVSMSTANSPGLVQFDATTITSNTSFLRRGNMRVFFDIYPPKLVEEISKLSIKPSEWTGLEVTKIIDQILFVSSHDDLFVPFPEVGDILFLPNYNHQIERTFPRIGCKNVCDIDQSIRCEIPGLDPKGYRFKRRRAIKEIDIARDSWKPKKLSPDTRSIMIHFGTLAYGNTPIMDGTHRDTIHSYTDALCFDAGAAAEIMDVWPCLVVKGICDYSDSHADNNQDWQPIAALNAAAFTKYLLLLMPGPRNNQGVAEANIVSVPGPGTDSGYSSMRHTSTLKRSEIDGDIMGQPLDELNLAPLAEHSSEQDDVATVYSDASSVSTWAKETYISELADALYKEVQSKCTNTQVVERIAQTLPELLKAFALRVGYDPDSQIYRDIMVFIHKNRKAIAQNFNTRSVPDQDDVGAQVQSLDNMSLDEVMSRWNERLDEMQDPNKIPAEPPMEIEIDLETIDQEDLQEEQENLPPELPVYRDVIFKTPAYQWLIGNLYRESLLDTTESDAMGLVRRSICENLPHSSVVSKRRSAEAFKVLFTIDLDLLSFVNEQGYEKRVDGIIEDILTLTGSADDAQALTTAQYMRQTWPFSGEVVIQLIKNALNSFIEGEAQNFHVGHLRDKTAIIVEMQDSVFLVEALGTRDSIAEIGEQLAWISASLRSSPLEVGISCCTPFVSEIYPVDSLRNENTPPPVPEFICKLDFSFESKESQNISPHNGRCWHAMFKNPIVVQGYPIPRKRKRNTGLEIPLNMMAGLVPTTRVNVFNEKVYIKGFSAMLIPIKQEDEVIIWHFIYNSNGDRISYVGNCIPHDQNITLSALETARHIVGWCAKTDYYAGAQNATYDIGSSQLPEIPCDRGHVFDSIRIKRGQLITGGSKFILGEKEKPLRVSRMGKDNRPALKWMRTKYVVLWDEEDKRGWLINGTSALLHLLRTSLFYESTDEDFSFEVCLDMNSLQEAPQSHHASSAANFLRNPHNMDQKVYPTSEGFYFVRDRFEEIFDLLEKIIDHQEDISKDWASKPRRYLEGWDFYDLAASEDPINPRVAIIDAMGKGWIDFIRAIKASILFGSGFGEIIKPVDSAGMCARWASLPKENYYIAADICDLRSLMKMRESQKMRARPMKIPNTNLIWHTPPESDLAKCRCAQSEHEIHSDFTQVFLPSQFSDSLPKVILTPWNNTGAVIFGHHINSEWVWKDTGHPQKGQLDSSTEEIETESWDSGIDFGSDITFQNEDYTIGILCALPKELWAVRALFDTGHRELYSMNGDPNSYVTGCFSGHNVVAACLPSGEYGTIAAARTLPNMIRTFSKLKFCFLVGIGAGIPSKEHDIRLGDVVVSQPTGIYSGVIQYDLGKELDGDVFERVGFLQSPPTRILNAISILRSNPNLPRCPLESYTQKIASSDWESKYGYPGIEKDQLLKACWNDSDHIKCIRCEVRGQNYIKVHYGLIASGNKVIKNAKVREQLSERYKALCIEMEAAGVMNTFPCVVVRGICDYADAEKSDIWQEYASATAAAYVKLLLRHVAMDDDVQDDLFSLSRKRVLTGKMAYEPHAKRQQ